MVGRVSAHVDHAYNRHHEERRGWFGFFECEDDPEAARALLEAAEAWLRERGMERMDGPADFTMNDESGIVIEGHELEPMVRQPWHPPYYQPLLEGAGLEKVVDLFMWDLEISDREQMLPILPELAADARDKHGVTIRRMSRRRLRKDLDVFAEIYNRAWRRNFGFVPYEKEDLDQYGLELQLAFDKDWIMVAEVGDEPVAIAMTFPDLNQVLRSHERAAAAAGVVALPAPGEGHHPRPRRLLGGQAQVPAHGRGGRAVRGALRHLGAPRPDQGRRDGVDPGDQPRDEPRHGGHERPDRQEVPRLRARAVIV